MISAQLIQFRGSMRRQGELSPAAVDRGWHDPHGRFPNFCKRVKNITNTNNPVTVPVGTCSATRCTGLSAALIGGIVLGRSIAPTFGALLASSVAGVLT